MVRFGNCDDSYLNERLANVQISYSIMVYVLGIESIILVNLLVGVLSRDFGSNPSAIINRQPISYLLPISSQIATILSMNNLPLE